MIVFHTPIHSSDSVHVMVPMARHTELLITSLGGKYGGRGLDYKMESMTVDHSG